MTKDLLRKAFEQIASDPDIIELAEWGIEDYAKIIASTARSVRIDGDL